MRRNLPTTAKPSIFAAPLSAMAILIALLGILTVAGCQSQAKSASPDPYPRVYQQVSESFANDENNSVQLHNEKDAIEAKFVKFRELFADIHHPQLQQLVEHVYAEEFYFNDTLQTHSKRETLIEYLLETQQKVDFNKVEIHEITPGGGGYYVRWSMDTGFTVFGKSIETHSIGITQIRLDQNGKVNFHQDFWDNTEGFFRHIPVVGYFINKTKQRL